MSLSFERQDKVTSYMASVHRYRMHRVQNGADEWKEKSIKLIKTNFQRIKSYRLYLAWSHRSRLLLRNVSASLSMSLPYTWQLGARYSILNQFLLLVLLNFPLDFFFLGIEIGWTCEHCTCKSIKSCMHSVSMRSTWVLLRSLKCTYYVMVLFAYETRSKNSVDRTNIKIQLKPSQWRWRKRMSTKN